jgi:putative membrane protein
MAQLKHTAYAALTIGLALAIGLIVWQGIDAVAAVLAVGGWSLILLGLYQIAPFMLATLSWRPLLSRDSSHRLTELTAVTWIGLSVNWLLPVAQVGGDLLRARLLILGGANGATTGASVVVDKTIQAAAQVVFSLLGLILLIAVAGTHVLAYWAAGFALVLSACLYGRTVGLLRRLLPRSALRASLPDARAFDTALGGLYRRRKQLVVSALWRVAERLAKAGEVWLALWLMGHPVSLVEALILESLIQAVRAAAFVVPAGIGVQEGGLVLIGAALGLSPDLSLALSLAKRFRELVVGLPGLLCWQLRERRHLKGTGSSDGPA